VYAQRVTVGAVEVTVVQGASARSGRAQALAASSARLTQRAGREVPATVIEIVGMLVVREQDRGDRPTGAGVHAAGSS